MLLPLQETTIEQQDSHQEVLSRRKQLDKGNLDAVHRYQNTALHALTSFNNPLNYRNANSELSILEHHRRDLAPLTQDHHQWHWGTGVGETEGEIARWQLEQGDRLDIVGVDMNAEFLEHFRDILIAKSIDFGRKEVRACFLHTLFQDAALSDVYGQNLPEEPIVQVCVGGVVGNFRDQSEIWSVFKGQARKGDKLIVGTQLNTHLKETFQKYKTHPHIPRMIFGDEGTIDPEHIEWHLNEAESTVTMTHHDPIHGSHEAFYHKKFTIPEMEELGKDHGFRMLRNRTDEYRNTCIALFEYQSE